MQNLRCDVLLVGAGNIGFRHLQGLGKIHPLIQLWVVDPDTSALERAAAEWQLIGGVAGRFLRDIEQLPVTASACVMATPARGRLELVRRLLPCISGDTIIIEKVAFTSISEMHAAGLLLDAAGKQAYVNCPRRIWPLYTRLRALLAGKRLALTVRGRDLGLGSNGVHFLDLLQYLSGETELQVVEFSGGKVRPAKRAGYYESYGRLRVITPGGSSIELSAMEEDPEQITINITSALGEMKVDEVRGIVTGEHGWIGERAPYQSELTGLVMQGLLDGRGCKLAPFSTSRAAHAPLLDVLGRSFTAAGIDVSSGVPIT